MVSSPSLLVVRFVMSLPWAEIVEIISPVTLRPYLNVVFRVDSPTRSQT